MSHEHRPRMALVHVLVADGDTVQIRSNLRKALDPCTAPAVIGALADYLGYEVRPLRKAVDDPASVDPRYPWLRTLIHSARGLWGHWGERLVSGVEQLVQAGSLWGGRDRTRGEEALHKLFREHEVGLSLSFAGYHPDRRTADDLVKRGLVESTYEITALVPVSFRMGLSIPPDAVHGVPKNQEPALPQITRRALDVPISPTALEAMDFARRRAATYMRRPAQNRALEIERVLTDHERAPIGEAVARAVEEGASSRELARELRQAASYSVNESDMDRVARTELANAHAHGAYRTLKDMTRNAGEDDPLVYKIVRPGACEDCARIWGPPDNPIRYRLSAIEAREAAGANFRKPRAEWGPVIGPVHPNCTEGALLYFREDIFDATQSALKDLDTWFGKT